MLAAELEQALARHAAAPRKPFLGVERSVTGRRWVERLDERGQATALDIAQRQGLPELLARVLAGRGVSADGAPAFLDPTVRQLMPDPSTLTDMDIAAARIADAIERKEPIAVFGDYDVDGATSSALMARFLRTQGLTAKVYIPDRLFEGYGPNREAVDKLKAWGASLMIAVDCGTTSIDPLEHAASLGIDVVIIDHHLAGTDLPPAVAIVNPNRGDDISGLGNLSAVGLVFMTLVAVNRGSPARGHYAEVKEPDLLQWLDLVALGTICDVVGLSGLNRAFVVKGLAVARRQPNPGLAALARAARLDGPLAPHHFGFVIGPRINAGGRIGNATLGATLLTSDDPTEIEMIAAELDRLNTDRQAIEAKAVAEAMAMADPVFAGGGDPAVLITHADGWHQGVVGLVAARLKERFHRPAFAIAATPSGQGVGSGRSIHGVDIGRAVKQAVADGLLVRGGGHAMAAGITLDLGRLREFERFMESVVGSQVRTAMAAERALVVDALTSAEGANLELLELVERAGPFGSGHPEPVLALPAQQIAYAEVAGGAHVRVSLTNGVGTPLKAMAFRAAETAVGKRLLMRDGAALHIAGTLSADSWQGRVRPSLRIIDVAEAGKDLA